MPLGRTANRRYLDMVIFFELMHPHKRRRKYAKKHGV